MSFVALYEEMGMVKDCSPFVEVSVLSELQSGSYESLLTSLIEAIEKSDFFSDGVSLFATHQDHAVVVSEEGVFSSVGYGIGDDGTVSLFKPKTMKVKLMSEGDVVSSGVNGFYNGDGIGEAMLGLMRMGNSDGGALEKLKSRLDRLFSGGQIWKKEVEKNREALGEYAWDARYGKITGFHPKFGGLEESDDLSEVAGEVISELVRIEKKLGEMSSAVQEAYVFQRDRTSVGRDVNVENEVACYESFASDYIKYLDEVLGFVSQSIKEANGGGCVLCAAMVHDEISACFSDLDLVGRLVRKVAAGFEDSSQEV